MSVQENGFAVQARKYREGKTKTFFPILSQVYGKGGILTLPSQLCT